MFSSFVFFCFSQLNFRKPGPGSNPGRDHLFFSSLHLFLSFPPFLPFKSRRKGKKKGGRKNEMGRGKKSKEKWKGRKKGGMEKEREWKNEERKRKKRRGHKRRKKVQKKKGFSFLSFPGFFPFFSSFFFPPFFFLTFSLFSFLIFLFSHFNHFSPSFSPSLSLFTDTMVETFQAHAFYSKLACN